MNWNKNVSQNYRNMSIQLDYFVFCGWEVTELFKFLLKHFSLLHAEWPPSCLFLGLCLPNYLRTGKELTKRDKGKTWNIHQIKTDFVNFLVWTKQSHVKSITNLNSIMCLGLRLFGSTENYTTTFNLQPLTYWNNINIYQTTSEAFVIRTIQPVLRSLVFNSFQWVS